MFSGKINIAYAFCHVNMIWSADLIVEPVGIYACLLVLMEKNRYKILVPVLCIPLTVLIFGSIFIHLVNSGCFDEKEVLLLLFLFQN